jgi:hypothetical protein
MGRLRTAVALIGLVALPGAARGQVPVVATGFAGGSLNIDDNGPVSGGGFAYQFDLGLHYPRISFGAEFAQHSVGGALKARVYGGFIRVPSVGTGAVRAYLVAGIGSYRFNPPAGGGVKTSSVGGSVGPGALFRLGSGVAFALEARFHSTFSNLPGLTNQQFISATAGLDLRL